MDKVMVLHPMVNGVDKYEKFFADQDDIGVKGLREGPDVILTRADQALAGMDSVRRAVEAEKDGYKAIVLTCHGDPNLFCLREAVRIPVLGPIQTSLHLCSLLSGNVSVLTTNEVYTKHSKEDLITRYGFASKIVSIRPVPFPISLFEVGMVSMKRPIPGEVFEPALTECLKAIEEDGAEAITFGCGAFLWMADELEKELNKRNINVLSINPVPATVEMARFLIRTKMSHSALAYPLAAKKL